MLHIVFAWEIGSGYGHLLPMAALGERLVQRGFRVSAVVPVSSQGRRMLEPMGIQVIDAPVTKAPNGSFPLSINYTANLLRNGYWHSQTVSQRIGDWQRLLAYLQPNLLICDHAPAALLASRDAAYPRAALGNGFTLPPRDTPMPSLQPWFPIPKKRLSDIDRVFLGVVDPILSERALPPLGRVDALFDGMDRWLCIEPELDHYPIRQDDTYRGAIDPPAALVSGDAPPWDGAEVFLYMASNNRFLGSVLQWLQRRKLPTLAYISGDSASLKAEYPESSHLHYLKSLVDLKQISAQCRLIVTHGGTLTASQVLKQGGMLLICPQDLEKALLAKRLADRKLARGLNWFAPDEPIERQLDLLISTDMGTEKLDSFHRYHTHAHSCPVLPALLDRVESLVAVA